MTPTFDAANSKLLHVVSFVDVDAEEHVDDSLVGILKLRFGRYFEPEFWSWVCGAFGNVCIL